jgi:3-methyladenine DNA glycosylase AlkD
VLSVIKVAKSRHCYSIEILGFCIQYHRNNFLEIYGVEYIGSCNKICRYLDGQEVGPISKNDKFVSTNSKGFKMVKDLLKELELLSDEKVKKHNTKRGVGENQYGVKLGDVRKIAKRLKTNHSLSLDLWETGNFDAQMLAILIMSPKHLSASELDTLVRDTQYDRVADWLNSYIVKLHPENESLRLKWMTDSNAMASRAGWNLTCNRIVKKPEILELDKLLDRIENEMPVAPKEAQWTMNFCLAEIGINHPKYRERAVQIGEKIGLYRDYPAAKGCVSPFVPIWVTEMVSRQKK